MDGHREAFHTMATIKQINANRLNSQKSTGPRSVEGKLRSSQNALKSGIDAESLIILGEDRAALESLTQEYVERFHPTTPEQRHYVDTLIRDDWQLRRLAKVDAQIWERELTLPLKHEDNAPHGRAYASGSTTFFRLQRRMDCAERSYQRALRELQRLEAIEEVVGRPFRLPPSFCSASNQDASSLSSACVAQVPDLRPQIGFVPQKSAEPIFSLAPLSQDLTRALGPYTLTPAHLFETPSRGLPK
jgi:hypothetical protein